MLESIKVMESTNASRRKSKIEEQEKKLQELKERYKASSEEGHSEEEHQEEPKEEANDNSSEAPEPGVGVSEEDANWKKRYGDLRREAQKMKDELKAYKEAKEEPAAPPADPAKVREWVEKYPEVSSIVRAIAEEKADKKFLSIKEKFQEIEKRESELRLKSMESQVKEKHNDFDYIKEDDSFHTWVDSQPKFIQDAVFNNSSDATALIRAIDLYKLDNKKPEPTPAINARGKTSPGTETGKKKIWSLKEIQSLQSKGSKEYSKYLDDIKLAYKEGRITG